VLGVKTLGVPKNIVLDSHDPHGKGEGDSMWPLQYYFGYLFAVIKQVSILIKWSEMKRSLVAAVTYRTCE